MLLMGSSKQSKKTIKAFLFFLFFLAVSQIDLRSQDHRFSSSQSVLQQDTEPHNSPGSYSFNIYNCVYLIPIKTLIKTIV